MARYTGAVCKLCRREGEKLFLKGDRCFTEKCGVSKRAYAPGQHGQARSRKPSEYGLQLRAKQRARRFYGVLESQFAHYFEIAEKKQGVTGENLLAILESRLDNMCYRFGWAMSRAEARQLVVHGHFTVNGRRVNIPSFLTKAGDVVAIHETSRDSVKIKAVIEANEARPTVKWLDGGKAAMEGKVINLPARADLDVPIEEQLIVEYYSK